MITRREFLGTSACAASCALVAGDSRTRTLSLTRMVHTVVVDTRSVQSREFGRELGHYGATVRPFAGDVTALWFDHLEPLWRQTRAAVAGLTRYSTLFCLERLSWDHGLRVVYRAQHPVQPLYSWVIALPRQEPFVS